MYRYITLALLIVFIFIGFYLFRNSTTSSVAQVSQNKPRKICLNMIVKDESAVIRRCLGSVKHLIDYWVIVDTGSKDGTQKIIKDYLKDIPGELHERPWKNFEHNRNEALKLAKEKCEYILFMDADDILEFDNGFQIPPLTKDLYTMWRGTKDFTYIKPQLARSSKPWKWVGVTHEYLGCDEYYTTETMQHVRYVTLGGGASAYDPRKFHKNIELLLDGLKKEPANSRYAFYLAESYRDAGEKGKALEWYQKVVTMHGWDQEIFWALLQIGHQLRAIGLPAEIVISSYKRAHLFRPHRAEPIYYLAELYNQIGAYEKAYACLNARNTLQKPAHKDELFNMDWIEEYGLFFQRSICSYYLGHYQESLDACNKLLAVKDLPDWIRQQTLINRAFPLAKLQIPAKGEAKSKSSGVAKAVNM